MRLSGIGLAVALLSLAGAAAAFGTYGPSVPTPQHQNLEHERITRHALGCGEAAMAGKGDTCFQGWSLQQVAGAGGTFGAVGAPDNPFRGLLSSPTAHCDNGDYLPPEYTGGQPYPIQQATAQAALSGCRDWMIKNLLNAVYDAALLLTANGTIDASQIPTANCTFLGQKGYAKCNVIEDFGLTLHAVQDFYSHSNWSDAADPTLPISRENPPGLHMDGPAPWLDFSNLNVQSAIPDGLISGCFVTFFEGADQNGCPGRVPHLYLNKDEGTIDTGTFQPGAGTTRRGAVADNFARAVSAAIADTTRQWETLQAMLIARYGPSRGATMICALTHDNPSGYCDQAAEDFSVTAHNASQTYPMTCTLTDLAWPGDVSACAATSATVPPSTEATLTLGSKCGRFYPASARNNVQVHCIQGGNPTSEIEYTAANGSAYSLGVGGPPGAATPSP